jgi:hypothetical protein
MTGLSYRSRDEERGDRRQQERLLAALDAAPSQLRRDEAGWWTIIGRRGSIHTWGDGRSFVAYVRCRSRQHWSFSRRRLAFLTVAQDGDAEGCLRLPRLPTRDEAVVIRDVMGLRKQVAYAPDTLERKRASMARAGLARGAATAPGLVPEAVPTVRPARTAGIVAINAVGVTGPEGRMNDRADPVSTGPLRLEDARPVEPQAALEAEEVLP